MWASWARLGCRERESRGDRCRGFACGYVAPLFFVYFDLASHGVSVSVESYLKVHERAVSSAAVCVA